LERQKSYRVTYSGNIFDPYVDPSLNPGYNIVAHQKVGKNSEILTITQMPNHSHGVNDEGHEHKVQSYAGIEAVSPHISADTNSSGGGVKTSKVPTGISIQSTGNNQPHNNVHPSIGCYYITYIP
jgi:microcystin-dependent protein